MKYDIVLILLSLVHLSAIFDFLALYWVKFNFGVCNFIKTSVDPKPGFKS